MCALGRMDRLSTSVPRVTCTKRPSRTTEYSSEPQRRQWMWMWPASSLPKTSNWSWPSSSASFCRSMPAKGLEGRAGGAPAVRAVAVQRIGEFVGQPCSRQRRTCIGRGVRGCLPSRTRRNRVVRLNSLHFCAQELTPQNTSDPGASDGNGVNRSIVKRHTGHYVFEKNRDEEEAKNGSDTGVDAGIHCLCRFSVSGRMPYRFMDESRAALDAAHVHGRIQMVANRALHGRPLSRPGPRTRSARRRWRRWRPGRPRLLPGAPRSGWRDRPGSWACSPAWPTAP